MSSEDSHIRHEVLANVVEGTIMGAIIGLKGPHTSARVANRARSRNVESKAEAHGDHDTRKVYRTHMFLLELMTTLQSCECFLTLYASARNDIWKFNFVKSLLNIHALDFHVFEIHTC